MAEPDIAQLIKSHQYMGRDALLIHLAQVERERDEARAEAARLREALEDMVDQFAGRGVRNKRRNMNTMGLSALEHAFSVLGWNDPHYPKDPIGCDWPDCPNWPSSGMPHPEGYKHYCSDHSAAGSAEARAALDQDPAKAEERGAGA